MCQRLKEWIAQKDISPAELGRRIGRTRMQVWRYMNDGVIPRPDVMDRITQVTEGFVTPPDFYGARTSTGPSTASEAAHAA